MAESDSGAGKKLSEIFNEGYAIYKELETTSLPFNSLEFQNKVNICTQLFENSTHCVNSIGMFSSNESVEEIATDDLQYLLLPFYLGQLSTKNSKRDREEVLKVADVYYKDFIKRCEEYEIVKSNNTEQQVVREEDASIRNLLQQANDRNKKIEQYRQKKQLEEQINEMKSIIDRDHVDDELKRDFYLKMIKLSILNAREEINSIKQELEILSFRNTRLQSGQSEDELRKSIKNNHHTTSKVEPLKPVIITKDDVQKAVFGIGYPSLPVMTVNDFYEERVREGIFPNAEQVVEMNKKMLQRRNSAEEEDREKAEKEKLEESGDPEYLERQRAMDEYKDEVRRGDGNRYNRS